MSREDYHSFLQKDKMTDMHTAALMADHFDKIQKLPNPVEGVPNWRCVPGYQVRGIICIILIRPVA